MGDDVVAVTGAASGIGLAVVEACLAAGWRVAAADRDAAGLASFAEKRGGRVTTAVVDVTHEAGVEAWIESAAASGRLVGLVTCAGVGWDVFALDTTAELFQRTHSVNVFGTFLCARAAGRAMEKGGGGSIVLVASVAGLRGSKGRVAYGSSKAAVINMAQGLAVDLASRGVRVNSLCPGPVDTPMVARLHDASTRKQWIGHMPMRRYGTPDEIASAATFLLDESQSSFITGQNLAVDGGFSGAGLTSLEA